MAEIPLLHAGLKSAPKPGRVAPAAWKTGKRVSTIGIVLKIVVGRELLCGCDVVVEADCELIALLASVRTSYSWPILGWPVPERCHVFACRAPAPSGQNIEWESYCSGRCCCRTHQPVGTVPPAAAIAVEHPGRPFRTDAKLASVPPLNGTPPAEKSPPTSAGWEKPRCRRICLVSAGCLRTSRK